MLLSLLLIRIDEITIAMILGLGGYFIIGTIPEEMKLNKYFTNYSIYKKSVGRFFPFTKTHLIYLIDNINKKWKFKILIQI